MNPPKNSRTSSKPSGHTSEQIRMIHPSLNNKRRLFSNDAPQTKKAKRSKKSTLQSYAEYTNTNSTKQFSILALICQRHYNMFIFF